MEKKVYKGSRTIILLVTFMSIIICVAAGIYLFYALFISVIFSSCLFIKDGFTFKELITMIKNSLVECRELFILILLVGITIPIWFSSGTIPAMIFYGFDYFIGKNLILAAFIFTSVVSIFIGSSIAAISTVGIALIGLGKVFHGPDYILLGAVVSGAFLADKLSPISGLANLMLSITKVSYRKALFSMCKTLLPAYAAAAAVYFYIGKNCIVFNGNLSGFKNSIEENFFVSPFLLLVLAAVFAMCFLGIGVIKSLSLGLIAGALVSIFIQKVSIVKIFEYILWGYSKVTGSQELNKILDGGGIKSVIGIIFIIMMAIALSSIFKGTGFINPVVDKIIHNVKGRGELILKTGIISGMLTLLCDQSVGVIMPGELLRDKYEELKIPSHILSRTISDTGIIIAPLIPWNGNSLFILALTGISSIRYSPYAFLCYILPIATFISGMFYKKLPELELKK
ncbi:Na+/H+ antiporter NhaC family protein [Clostridium luticellarii]|jgi:NhaC family Na+:H+ antiporter|uniref:Na(+)/H(+) antiporter NhaC n=1 Tax=Clostridium luticellarii TaxID=1691940 RepID=A0A2T0BPL3_9CLOT|nr:Na+/H+ antiporter NhaC family protein [Clostridium luticellarii]PRR85807.1 Na(+)/H(+) antiporter NhaC [Clostridium luticellarii]